MLISNNPSLEAGEQQKQLNKTSPSWPWTVKSTAVSMRSWFTLYCIVVRVSLGGGERCGSVNQTTLHSYLPMKFDWFNNKKKDLLLEDKKGPESREREKYPKSQSKREEE